MYVHRGIIGSVAGGASALDNTVGRWREVTLLNLTAGQPLAPMGADSVPGPATAGANGKREAFNATRDDLRRQQG